MPRASDSTVYTQYYEIRKKSKPRKIEVVKRRASNPVSRQDEEIEATCKYESCQIISVERGLLRHKTEDHDKLLTHHCRECDQEFDLFEDLDSHFMQNHVETKETENEVTDQEASDDDDDTEALSCSSNAETDVEYEGENSDGGDSKEESFEVSFEPLPPKNSSNDLPKKSKLPPRN